MLVKVNSSERRKNEWASEQEMRGERKRNETQRASKPHIHSFGE